MLRYDLFLFDLDDTLLDFKASERLAFGQMIGELRGPEDWASLYARYQIENQALWGALERGETTQSLLKTERFRRTFAATGVDLDPVLAGARYLEQLPRNVVLVEHAAELCEWLSQRGEIGVITNGIASVQAPRIRNSALAPYIRFVAVSEECGFAKPDRRFFEYGARLARKFESRTTLMIGDRLETDIEGAVRFGIDSCWFNPAKAALAERSPRPTHEISRLSALRTILETPEEKT